MRPKKAKPAAKDRSKTCLRWVPVNQSMSLTIVGISMVARWSLSVDDLDVNTDQVKAGTPVYTVQRDNQLPASEENSRWGDLGCGEILTNRT